MDSDRHERDRARSSRAGRSRPLPVPCSRHTSGMDVEAVIEQLGLRPHPEGGHYCETWRGDTGGGGRAVGTAILFLLAAGERSHWHRVDAAEVWLHHAGDPLGLSVVSGAVTTDHVLGSDLAAGQLPQAVVPPGAWQSARSTGRWSLMSCVVAPGFEFDGFELAPPDWRPSDI